MGRYERLAYERQERDLRLAYGERWNDVTVYGDPTLTQHPKGYYFDLERGERTIEFIERFCKHHKGEWAGKELLLEPWQKFIQATVYGWLRHDGTRRFRTAYEEVARKNGKSERISANGVYLQVGDGEPGAEIYSTATKEDQAKIVWGTAVEMVKQSKDLLKWIEPRQKALICERTKSVFKPLGADSDTLDGLNPHGHLCDEMHAHKKRALFDVMDTAMGARRQPITFVITTAGIYDPEAIGWQMHVHAQQVLDGVIEDDTFFAIIFAMDKDDDWTQPDAWYKANPNLGVSVKYDYIKEQCEKAQKQPSFLNTFLRLHLNVWTQQVTRWIPLDAWKLCGGIAPALIGLRGPKLSDLALEPLRGRVAYAGLDLSTKLDITSAAFSLPLGEAYDMFWRFWVPQELVRERTRMNKSPDYAAWVRDGWLIETPGNVIDYEFIRNDITRIGKVLNLRQIAYDPWSASQLATQMQSDGFELVEVRQGMRSLSEPSKEFEKLVVSGRIRHGGNPIMEWMVDNAAIRRDANDNIAPDKRSAAGKIDGLVASIMSLSRAILEPPPKKSVYETRGVRVIG